MSEQANISGLPKAQAVPHLPSVKHRLLKQNVAEQLREAILSGQLTSGEKIIENRWARQFGVAQVSVREALNILVAEGFVTKGHGRSARVLKLSDSDIIHTYQFRGALEGLAARLTVERKLPLGDLEACMMALREAVATNDVRKVIDRCPAISCLPVGETRQSLSSRKWTASRRSALCVHPDAGIGEESRRPTLGGAVKQSPTDYRRHSAGESAVGRADRDSRRQLISESCFEGVGALDDPAIHGLLEAGNFHSGDTACTVFRFIGSAERSWR